MARLQRTGENRLPARPGLGLAEVIVVLAVVGLVVLVILAALPRQREKARGAQCESNLMHIGMGLMLYEQPAGKLPGVPALAEPGKRVEPSPLGAMLDELGVDTFQVLKNAKQRPSKTGGGGQFERPVAGFVCPSDPLATPRHFPAPVSYRANTGDQPGGVTGPFAPGKTVAVSDVEAADGLAYTAAFSERLVGTGEDVADARNYILAAAPLGAGPCSREPASHWRGNAGGSWLCAGWVDTLYNHAAAPSAPTTCVAADGQTALLSASSGHVGQIHVLLLDGSVRIFAPRVDPRVWRALGNIDDSARVKKAP